MSSITFSSPPVVEKPEIVALDIIHACLVDGGSIKLAEDLFSKWSKMVVTSMATRVIRAEKVQELVHPMWVQQKTIGLALSRSNEEWNRDAATELERALRQFFLSVDNSRPSFYDNLVFLGALHTDVKMLAPEYAKFTWKQTYTVGLSEEEARRRAEGASAS